MALIGVCAANSLDSGNEVRASTDLYRGVIILMFGFRAGAPRVRATSLAVVHWFPNAGIITPRYKLVKWVDR